ncbi:DUF72 domain-containing protein [Anaerobacillus sp. MEB173]|uniref:DUF72 domain-containing protein n=1 Tax=Anaerobacillus sp. MEB173 TaxID=3383345 RepID=UPI003F9143A3
MIYIGLTGWGDHDDLYEGGTKGQDKLAIYSSHFPIVEIDSSFYAIQPLTNYNKWTNITPSSFSFVVKAYQGITGHIRGDIPFANKAEMFQRFVESVTPLVTAGKLKMVLCQFPPWFECNRANVDYLRYCKEKLENLPVALEFRHQSWFAPHYYDKTLVFMEKEGWIHSICDEPQAGKGSVPTVLHPTYSSLTLVRFHGRNKYGWNDPGTGNWREVRYLYRYSEEELAEWVTQLRQLEKDSEEVCVLFNNNSGGDAAANAKQLIEMLGITYTGLAPQQLKLFE